MRLMKKASQQSRANGFTLIEMTLAIVVLLILGTFFILQRNDLKASQRDQLRKQAVNTMAYSLIEVFYKQNGYYPRFISRDNLPMVEPTLFTDPDGFTLHGEQCTYTKAGKQETNGNCNYKYSAQDCDNQGRCKAFTLRAELERESAFERKDNKAKQ